MAAGLNIGGATVTNSVSLAAATGFDYGWVFLFATFAIYVATLACVKLSLVTEKNPIKLIRDHIHPVAGYAVGISILLVNLVFHTIQVVLGGMVLNTLIPVNQGFWQVGVIVMAALFALVPAKAATDIIAKTLQWMVYILSASFLLSLFVVPVNWGGFFRGILPLTLPTSKQSVLLFTAVLGSALAINVPTIQAFASRSKGWNKNQLQLFGFETAVTNIFLLFVQLAVLVVVASTLFPARIVPKNAVEAALALKPLAGGFSTVLFCIGLFGAVLSTMVAQTAVAAYTFLDTVGWDPQPGSARFKIVQACLLLVALCVPLFGLNPFTWTAWGGAFNSTFMPIGIAAWWALLNRRELMGEHKADTRMNIAMAVTFAIALAGAVRFWYVTLS
ncbi:MAG: NRAMP family divalent metal transporter [Bacillota bacterium]